VNYEERIVALKDAIAALKDSSVSVENQNLLLKAIVDTIELKTTDAGHDSVEVGLKMYLRL
jgi:L-lysine 2,3-aminomutase